MIYEISLTVAAVLVGVVLRLLLKRIIERKLGELAGYQNITNAVFLLLSLVLALYVLSVWNISIIEIMTALGLLGGVLLLIFKDIWISNIFAGISLIGDKAIHVGTKLEIKGRQGEITEITLTITKVRTNDGYIITIPNKKFREDVIVMKPNRAN